MLRVIRLPVETVRVASKEQAFVATPALERRVQSIAAKLNRPLVLGRPVFYLPYVEASLVGFVVYDEPRKEEVLAWYIDDERWDCLGSRAGPALGGDPRRVLPTLDSLGAMLLPGLLSKEREYEPAPPAGVPHFPPHFPPPPPTLSILSELSQATEFVKKLKEEPPPPPAATTLLLPPPEAPQAVELLKCEQLPKKAPPKPPRVEGMSQAVYRLRLAGLRSGVYTPTEEEREYADYYAKAR